MKYLLTRHGISRFSSTGGSPDIISNSTCDDRKGEEWEGGSTSWPRRTTKGLYQAVVPTANLAVTHLDGLISRTDELCKFRAKRTSLGFFFLEIMYGASWLLAN